MLYVVLRRGGRDWRAGVGPREQSEWTSHAAFMDGLVRRGVVRLGGPIDGKGGTLLVCETASEPAVREVVDGDPWSARGILETEAVYAWEVLLGHDVPGDVPRPPHPYVAVVFEQGDGWTTGVPMREQRDWTGHAAFMNALSDSGFVVIGGPLRAADGVHRALLVVRAGNDDEVRRRLADDPWTVNDNLRIGWARPWTLLLGGSDG